MAELSPAALEHELRARIDALEFEVADLKRHNEQLREAIAALLAPDQSSSHSQASPDQMP